MGARSTFTKITGTSWQDCLTAPALTYYGVRLILGVNTSAETQDVKFRYLSAGAVAYSIVQSSRTPLGLIAFAEPVVLDPGDKIQASMGVALKTADIIVTYTDET